MMKESTSQNIQSSVFIAFTAFLNLYKQTVVIVLQ